MIAITLAVSLISAFAWILPVQADKYGWGLRVRALTHNYLFLKEERLEQDSFEVTLINQSKELRKYLPLTVALRSSVLRNLEVHIICPDGQTLRAHGPLIRYDFPKELNELAAGQLVSSEFDFQQFRHDPLTLTGNYELRANLNTAEGLIVAPSFKFKVIEPTSDAILASRPIPLEGFEDKLPKKEQRKALVQHIKTGNKTWLFYRRFQSPELGGKPIFTFRIAELPGKVEDLKVEGAYGGRNPLTITYRENTYTKFTTTHVINSVDGRPWTAEEEKHRQDKLKREGKLPPTDKK